jgi:polyribonucleotide nucleotidyltransferase
MIECGAKEMPKDVLKQAFLIAQKQIDYICDIQNEFLKKLTIQKKEVVFNKPSEALIAYISNILT